MCTKYLEHPTFYLPKSLFKQISSIVNGLLQPNLTTSRPHNQPVSCQVKDQKKNSVKQKCVYPPFNCILEVWLTDCAIIQENSGAGAVFPRYLSWRMLENNGNKTGQLNGIQNSSKKHHPLKLDMRPLRKNVLARNINTTSKNSTKTLSSYNEIPCSSTCKSRHHHCQSQTSLTGERYSPASHHQRACCRVQENHLPWGLQETMTLLITPVKDPN